MAMFEMKGARRRRKWTLLIRTYCLGLIPIGCMVLFMEDGDLLSRGQCAVRGFLHSHGTFVTKAGAEKATSGPEPVCCAPLADVLNGSASGANPVLLRSNFGTGCGEGGDVGKDYISGCVYGMNFGPKRGASKLSVGAAPLAEYEKWIDHGAPYGAGHYGEICGRASNLLHAGPVSVQLTTPVASSNTPLTNRQ
jgi:hypothetical protein